MKNGRSFSPIFSKLCLRNLRSAGKNSANYRTAHPVHHEVEMFFTTFLLLLPKPFSYKNIYELIIDISGREKKKSFF
jgi:hypothetical protein